MENQKKQNMALDKLRQRVEELLKNKPPPLSSQLMQGDELKLLHELEVHQIELELQNEELLQAEKEAQLSAEKYAELFDFAPLGYFIVSDEGNIIGLNLRGAQMLAKERSLLLNSRFGFFVTNDTKPIFNRFLDNLFKSGKNEFCEITLLTREAHPVFVHLSGIVNGTEQEVLVAAVDITERKQAEEALQESEIKYRLMLESSEIGVGVYSLDGKILYYNQRALHNLGGKADDYIGKSLHEIFGEAAASVFVSRIRESAQSEKSIEYEEFVQLTSGDRWFLSIYSRLAKPDGKVYGVQVIAHDITERKQTEEKLLVSTAFANSLIASMEDGVSVLDTNGKHLDVNPAFCQMTGFTREELIVTSAPYPYWPPEEYVTIGDAFQKTMAGEKGNFELTFMRKNGERFPVHISPFAIKDNIGNIISYSATVKDISERKKAEIHLQQSEHYLAEAERIGNTGSWEYDVASDTAIWSDNMFRIFDVDPLMPKELVFKYFVGNLVHPNDRANVVAVFQDALAGRRAYDLEYRILKSGNSTRYIHALAEVIRDADGNPLQMIGKVEDITERKQADIELKASEEKFKNMVQEMQVGVLLQGPQSEIIVSNPKALELLGVTEDQLLGKTSFDPDWNVIHEDGSLFPGNTHPVPQAIANRQAVHDVIMGVYHPLKGERVWLKVDAEPQLNKDGTVQQVVCTFIDISIGKQAQEALLKSEEQFRGLFENSLHSVAVHQVVLDEYGNPVDYIFLRANAAFERQTGLRIADIVGKRVTEVLPGIQDSPFIGIYGKVALSGEPVTFDQLFEPLGKLYHINAYQVGYGFFVTVFQDITESKRIEEEIKNKNEELEKLNIEKDKFFSIIAHDLRSPFNSFLGLTKMIEEELPSFSPDELQSSISSMRKSAGIVFHLLENLLEWSRMQRGLHTFRPVTFRLSEQLIENMNLVRLASEKKYIRIIQQIPDGLAITADPQMFQSLMSNLVFNAIKFTSFGGEVTIAAKEMPDKEIVISVSDNGIGMDKATLDNLFNINRSNYRKGTEGEPSTGLGLVICKDFVEKHGGEIWVESENGKGSTFYFSIPHIHTTEEEKGNENAGTAPGNIVRDGKLKILVAEDDQTTQMFMSIALKPLSREIIKAVTGVEAVNACTKHPDIDLILMDIRMPEMDGYEATRQIRKFNKNVVIIAQTAFIMADNRKQAMAAGCDEFIPKPIDLNLLKGMIHKRFGTN